MKEKRKVKVEEQQKKLAFGIFVDLWICENWNILYEKWVNVFCDWYQYQENVLGKKSKKYSAKKKNKKKSNVWKNREKIKKNQ